MAVRGSAEDPATVQVLEDRDHVAAAGPGRVTKACGGQRPGVGQDEGALGQLGVGRRGPGEVVLDPNDPAGSLEATNALTRAGGRAGCFGQQRRRSDRQHGLKPIHRFGECRRATGLRQPQPIAVVNQPTLINQPVDSQAHHARRMFRVKADQSPKLAHEGRAEKGCGQPTRRGLACVMVAHGRDRRVLNCLRDIGRETAVEGAMKVEPRRVGFAGS